MAEILEKKFAFSDAWMFASLSLMGNSGNLDLCQLIAAGDGLNHAILTEKEIKLGLRQCQVWGLITINNRHYQLTKPAKILAQKAILGRGGAFSVINNFERLLNSRLTKLQVSSDI
jgi:hypothetical protein